MEFYTGYTVSRAKIYVEDKSISIPSIREPSIHRGSPSPYGSGPRNVILFGEAGVGKSSVVNLIAGAELAKTSPDADAGTFASMAYHVILQGNQPFWIWDTVGLNEPEVSRENYLRAVKQAYKLIKVLERSGGVHLLVLCMRGGITKAVQQNYRLFTKVFCEKKVPLCVVVTNLENEPDMEEWWTINEEVFRKYGISADGHACITASPGVGDVFRSRYEESGETLRKLLLDLDLQLSEDGWKKEARTWLTDLSRKLVKMLPLPSRHRYGRLGHPTYEELMKKLIHECGFSRREAMTIATSVRGISDETIDEDLEWSSELLGMSQVSPVSSNPDPASYQDQRDCAPNVLIVGGTGVGKSSVINLIAGEDIADVSSRAGGCTMGATSYDVVLADKKGRGHHVRLFDTVGLNDPSLSKSDYLTAIEKANVLITQLLRTGGIRLLLFCIRGGRITSVTQNNYRLFRDILCQNQVPVAFVITGMENEHPMEGWWSRNAAAFERSNLFCTSHVCVTATRGLKSVYAKQYQASQVAIHSMLLDHMSKTSWKPERPGWFIHLAGKLLRWVNKLKDRKRHLPVRSKALTVEELARRLEDKCNFAPEEAVELAGKVWAKRMELNGSDIVKGDDLAF